MPPTTKLVPHTVTPHTLVTSCKNNAVEPWAYLKNIFTRPPTLAPDRALPTDLASLLPGRWLLDNPTHRWSSADTRESERR